MEKVIPSLLAALLPFIATYFSKINKASIRKNAMEDAQKKVDFLNSYYEVSIKLLPEIEIQTLKNQLTSELNDAKSKVDAIDKQDNASKYEKLSLVQKLFLTFKPASNLGWIWAICFYCCLFIVIFGLLGCFVDEKNDFTMDAFHKSFEEEYMIASVFFYIILLFLFRWFAARNYRNRTKVA